MKIAVFFVILAASRVWADQPNKIVRNDKAEIPSHVKILGHVLKKVEDGYLIILDSTAPYSGYKLVASTLHCVTSVPLADGDKVELEIYRR